MSRAFLALASVLVAACGSSSIDDIPSEADAGADAIEAPEEDAGITPEDASTTEEDASPPPEQDAAPPEQDATTPPPPEPNPKCPTSVKNPAAYTGINANPKFLQVYVNNVENLELPTDQCHGDWKDLFYYMKLHPSPDVFLVQQISGKAQLDELTKYMTDHLPGTFEGIVAEANPKKMGSPCGAPKAYQTNAIIYRSGRLKPVGAKETFQVQSFRNGGCLQSLQSRTIAVMQKFHDTVAQKNVSVASMHWGTAQGTGPDPACAEHNVQQMANKIEKAAFGGALMIFGGDANESDRNSQNAYKDWYHMANGDLGGKLGYRDAIFNLCDEKSGPVKACLDDNWTGGAGGRIDFLWAKRGDGCLPMMTGQHTISYQEGDAAAKQVTGADSPYNYSGHRAIRAQVHY